MVYPCPKNTKAPIESIAPEVMYNILSFMSYVEVYRIRGVCRKFQVMCEYHIYIPSPVVSFRDVPLIFYHLSLYLIHDHLP